MKQTGHGAVIASREKTELKKLINKLTEMKILRIPAQTHEFSNSFTRSWSVRAGEYDEAIELIRRVRHPE